MLKAMALIGLLAAAPARAADSDGRFSPVGLGGAPCSVLGVSVDDMDALTNFSAGFITAVNWAVPGSVNHFPEYITGGVFADMLRAECERHPDASVAQAAAMVWAIELKRGR